METSVLLFEFKYMQNILDNYYFLNKIFTLYVTEHKITPLWLLCLLGPGIFPRWNC